MTAAVELFNQQHERGNPYAMHTVFEFLVRGIENDQEQAELRKLRQNVLDLTEHLKTVMEQSQAMAKLLKEENLLGQAAKEAGIFISEGKALAPVFIGTTSSRMLPIDEWKKARRLAAIELYRLEQLEKTVLEAHERITREWREHQQQQEVLSRARPAGAT
jgi:hypothetical protein